MHVISVPKSVRCGSHQQVPAARLPRITFHGSGGRPAASTIITEAALAELNTVVAPNGIRSRHQRSNSVRPAGQSSFEDLTGWIQTLGGETRRVELGLTNLNGVQVRGLVLREDVSEGEVVLSVPLSAAFIDSKIDPPYPDAPWNITLAAFLLKEKQKGAQSKWAPYLDVLPPNQDSPLYFDSATHASLHYEPAMLALLSFKACVVEGWEQLSSLGDPAYQSMEEFAWAMLMVHSRALRLAMLGIRALIPGIDLLNHGGDLCNGHLALGRAVWALEDGGIVNFVANRDMQRGEQVLWTYGDRSNDDFFLYHGFVLDNNPHDNVVLFNSVDHVVRWYTSLDPERVPDRAHMAALIYAASQASESAAANADQAPTQMRKTSNVPSTVLVPIMQQVVDDEDEDIEGTEAPNRSWWRHELGGQPWWQWGVSPAAEEDDDEDLPAWRSSDRSRSSSQYNASSSSWQDRQRAQHDPNRHAHHRRRSGSWTDSPSTPHYEASPSSSMWFGPGMSGSHSRYEEASRAQPSSSTDDEPAVVIRIQGPSPDGPTHKRELRRQWSIYTEGAVRVQGSFRLHKCDWGVPGDKKLLTGAHPMPEMLVQSGGMMDVRLLACLQFLQHAWGVPNRLQAFVASQLSDVEGRHGGDQGNVLFGESGAADLAWCGAVWMRCEEMLKLMPSSVDVDVGILEQFEHLERKTRESGGGLSQEQQQQQLAVRYRLGKKRALQQVASECKEALTVC